MSKVSDADTEAGETSAWLDFALACGFPSETDHAALRRAYDRINRQLVTMMNCPGDWCQSLAARPATPASSDED